MKPNRTIEVSWASSVKTIVYLNKSLNNGPTVWVAENAFAFEAALAELKSKPHIEILESGNSHVAFENDYYR